MQVLLNASDQFINVVIEICEIDCVCIAKCTTNCLVIILNEMIRNHFSSKRSHSMVSIDRESQVTFEIVVDRIE